jgi:anti-sigma regulatory factor (Ser/Thr protein kinase)
MREQAIVLPAEAGSAVQARQFVRDCLRWNSRRGAVEDAALLCVTELVANVARHTPARECVVKVVEDNGDLTIEVTDDYSGVPAIADPSDPMEEAGRGLRIVDALAGEWGVRPHPGDGKSIWLRL